MKQVKIQMVVFHSGLNKRKHDSGTGQNLIKIKIENLRACLFLVLVKSSSAHIFSQFSFLLVCRVVGGKGQMELKQGCDNR